MVDENNYKEYQQQLTIKKLQKHERTETFNLVYRVLAIIVSILLVVMVLRVTRGGVAPTFTSLLEKLSTSNVPTIPFINTSFVTLGDWGNLLNPIRDFIRLLLDIINVGLFLCNGIISAITYIVWLLQWCFGA